MNDRELLELAAKVIGIQIHCVEDEDGLGCARKTGGEPAWVAWNPIADDGDALRLAVTADIEVFQGDSCDWPAAFAGYFKPASLMGRRYCIEYHGDHHSDQMAATRRAITRAAAEIGKNMGAV